MYYWLWFCLILTAFAQQQNLCPQYSRCKCLHNGSIKLNIICAGLTDLTIVRDLLHKDFPSKIFDMILIKPCSVTKLEKDIFKDAHIGTIITYCPFGEIDNDTFTSIRDLWAIQLWNTTFRQIPVAVSNLPELVSLRINDGKLSTLTKENVRNLTNLRLLTLSGQKISHIEEDVFKENLFLQSVSFDSNQLEEVPKGAFDLLEAVVLSQNSIRNVDGVFDNTKRLKALILSYNKLESMDHAFNTQLSGINKLDLSGNLYLYNISSQAFANKLTKLKTFKMALCKIQYLEPKLLSFSNLFTEVYLDRNLIVEIPKEFFYNLVYLTKVDMKKNLIISLNGIFRNNRNLQNVSFYSNNIRELGDAFQEVTTLVEINLKDNKLTSITEKDFTSNPNLISINLAYNQIKSVDTKSFWGLKKLQLLNLGYNYMPSLNGTLKSLSSLQQLILNTNQLISLNGEELEALPKILKADFSGNRIRLMNRAFVSMVSLTWLDLSTNQLETLSKGNFPEAFKVSELHLSGNNFTCDCRLLWLYDLSRNGTLEIDEFKCIRPMRFHRKYFQELDRDDLVTWPNRCPSMCSCTCEPEGDDFHVRASCANQNLKEVPRVFPERLGELDLQNNSLIRVEVANVSRELTALNLENNTIVDMRNITVPPSLRELRIAGNNLTRFLVQNRIKNITRWSLSSNPWKCDCQGASSFKKWLLENSDKVIDLYEIRCDHETNSRNVKGKVIVNLKYYEFCPTTIAIYIAITIAALGVLVFTAFSILIYSRYQIYAKAWLFSRGMTWIKPKELDKDKEIDAFIIHSELDEVKYLHAIVRELETKEPWYKLCIPLRNYAAGNDLLNAHEYAMSISKRIIILLSEKSINDFMCVHLFRRAFDMSLEDKTYRLIIVIIGKLTPTSEMDECLKVAIKTTRCLRWGQKMFWQLLRYEMPKITPEKEAEDEPVLNGTPVVEETSSELNHSTDNAEQPLLDPISC